MKVVVGAVAVCALLVPGASYAAEANRSDFGKLRDGRSVEAVTLTNSKGMTARVISYGAILQSVIVPDRQGKSEEVSLGYDSIEGYIVAPSYFGATVGRYANRIRDAKFTLDGKTYELTRNNSGHTLHGGPTGFDKRLWTIDDVRSGPVASVRLRYVSADGEEGYPGQLTVTATYSLDEDNVLTVDYEATTTKPTIVNISNHSFFNLSGESSQKPVYGHYLTIPADTVTAVERGLIPTGEFRLVAGTPFDFRKPTLIGERIRDMRDPQIVLGQGYDHNFVVARTVADKPRLLARVEAPDTGRILDVYSNQPGVQLYTANYMTGTAIGRSGQAYRQGEGIALEPQLFPNTPNELSFGSARLDPGQTYRNTIAYHFRTTAP